MRLELHWRSEDGIRLPMALWRPGPGYQMISTGIALAVVSGHANGC